MEYRTLREAAEAEYVDRKSRFIAHAYPVQTEEEALERIRLLRTQYWDARHNVYAYVLRSGAVRYSDDSEPQGTAGIPTLEVLTKGQITDALIVTTRYFGGVLLGTGGLTRAYSRAAHDAVQNAGIVRMCTCKTGFAECDYAQYSAVSRTVGSFGTVDGTEYGQNVAVRFHMAPARNDAFLQALADATCGAVTVQWGDETFFPEADEPRFG